MKRCQLVNGVTFTQPTWCGLRMILFSMIIFKNANFELRA